MNSAWIGPTWCVSNVWDTFCRLRDSDRTREALLWKIDAGLYEPAHQVSERLLQLVRQDTEEPAS